MRQFSVTREQNFLLGRECALAAMSIGQGLTMIRKYDFVKHAYGNQAFFMLSVGLERLLKIIIIYNHRRTNQNTFPNNAELKKAGHDIKGLYNKAIIIADEIGKPELYRAIKEDPISDLIIECITDFANKARYYNLDMLTDHQNFSDEPLRAWNKKINKIIVERHYRHNEKKANAINAITKAVGDYFLVSFDDEEGKEINNLHDFYLEGMTAEIKRKYSMFYIYCIVRFFCNLLWHLDKEYYPVVSEYFVKFRIMDDSYVKSLKTWNLYEN